MPQKNLTALISLSLLICFSRFSAYAQEKNDSVDYTQLPDVTVRAFEQNRSRLRVPAPVQVIGRQTLERFGSASIVDAVNTTPGVRMEERSPGSYRFNIRGSSLRSPFGVRNVKVYYNDIPITDPGGQTYLNELGSYNFNSIEIVKGAASSLYGAGTGGALLIESMNENEKAGAYVEYTTGSYGLQNIYGAISTGSQKLVSRASYQHQQSTGYRDHSALRRDVQSWTGLFKINEKKFLKASYLYGDLFYETPGGLTKSEYDANRKAARPAGGAFPSAEQAKAAIRQRMVVAGVSYDQAFAPHWKNKTVLYGMFTELRNPAIRNYGKNSEPHGGGRTAFTYSHALNKALFNFIAGGEWQQGFSSVAIHTNQDGDPDSLQTYDEIHNRQRLVFSQASLDVSGWTVQAGASWNWLNVRFERFTPAALGFQRRDFNNQIAPRVAVMKRFETGNSEINLYSAVSKGFSPPTRDELVPTGGAINLELDPEKGTNYELGAKARIAQKLFIDVDAFSFNLHNTIVQRRDAGGGDFYINSGKTNQRGVETFLSYPLAQQGHFEKGSVWISHTFHKFRYGKFVQGSNDYSGNQMPGDPKHSLSAGIDASLTNRVNAALSVYHAGRIPLNDGNTAFADAYNIVNAKIGWEQWLSNQWRMRLNLGVANLLNEKYSLGNDLNAFGGRYYNAAPERNFFVSLLVQWASKKALL